VVPAAPPPHKMKDTFVIIPALNEEKSIALVLRSIPMERICQIIVVDNGSTDQTAAIVEQLGHTVLREPKKGYGKACLKGLHYVQNKNLIGKKIAFLDADFSDDPAALSILLDEIDNGQDFVLGSRSTQRSEKGALSPHQVFGNKLALFLTRIIKGKHPYTDLSPFRVLRAEKLNQLKMEDQNFGWTIEMQLKALDHGLKIKEVPLRYRRRIGQSKISGTIKGSFMAGFIIIKTIFRYSFT
jgi:glycosyltransferase involved in cell wall biosynthesis